VTDEMFATAARSLAHEVLDSDLAQGRVYPALSRIRDVSAVIAAAVAELAYRRDLARTPRPEALDAHVRSLVFDPSYESYV
jgi:malate dehydrogenase (oxaloacetate-decarboxylating)(NADP+)